MKMAMLLILLLPLLGITYTGWHLWCLLPLPAGFRLFIIACCAISFALIFLNFNRTIDHWPMWLARLNYEVGSSSVFILLYMVLIFLALDLGRLLHIVPRHLLYQNVYTSVAVTLTIFFIFLLGNIRYYHKQRVELSLQTEKALEKPMKLLMVSDLHLGYHNPRKELRRWVDMFNAEQPDLVLIAGDLIDMSLRPLEEENMAEELRRISAPVYACLGNHEFYSNKTAAQKFIETSGIHLLKDSSVTIGSLTIIGRDDRTNMHRRPLNELTEKADMNRYTILLDHQPYHLEEAEQAGIDLQFSGHTHHGQVWPISWITDAIYECAYGEHQRGRTRYYVSSGLGIWGGKFRIGTQSEYVVATLSPTINP
jgi:predicted MPP superfamily phosphohydrolase